MDNQPPITPAPAEEPDETSVQATPEEQVTAPALAVESTLPVAAPVSPVAVTPEEPEPVVTPTVSATPPAEPQAAPAAEFAAPSHPKRLLLVEDDDSLANVYVTRLQTEGFDVRRVANGEEALAAALNYHPDLIILDVMMPKVSGFDVLDILRNTPETANVKIVMLTALSQESDKERAESLGVDDYLVKSQVVIADVIDRIKHHLNVE